MNIPNNQPHHVFYTIKHNKHAEEIVNSHMNALIYYTERLKRKNGIEAIILSGSYGRGDGSILPQQGTIIPVNDYNFYIITNDMYTVKALKTEFMTGISTIIKHIPVNCTFSFYNKKMLPTAPFQLMWYDIKYGSKVIYGNKNILSLLPEYASTAIPLSEGLRLLVNRAIFLIREKSIPDILSYKTKLKHLIALHKLVFACGDAVLIALKLYSPCIADKWVRLKRVKSTTGNFIDELKTVYKECLHNKYALLETIIKRNNITGLYHRVKKLFFSVFKWYEERRLGQPALTWEHYPSLILKSEKSSIRHLLQSIRNGHFTDIFSQWGYIHPHKRIAASLPFIITDTASQRHTAANAGYLTHRHSARKLFALLGKNGNS